MWAYVEAIFALFGLVMFVFYVVVLFRPPRTADQRAVDKLAAKK